MGTNVNPTLSSRRQSGGTCAHLLLHELQNCNLLLNKHPQENAGSQQKMIPHTQGQRRSPSKMIEGAKSRLESNPIPTGDTRRAQTKPCAHQAQRPQRPATPASECLSVSCGGRVSSGLPHRGSTAALGHAACGISPLGGDHHCTSPTTEPPSCLATENWIKELLTSGLDYEVSQDKGNRLSQGTKKTECTRTRGREQ